MPEIIFENLSKTYPNGVKAVTDFSLNIREGEFIVLVGPSGCGMDCQNGCGRACAESCLGTCTGTCDGKITSRSVAAKASIGFNVKNM